MSKQLTRMGTSRPQVNETGKVRKMMLVDVDRQKHSHHNLDSHTTTLKTFKELRARTSAMPDQDDEFQLRALELTSSFSSSVFP